MIQKDILNNSQRDPLIRVRCPECYKPFVVKENLITQAEPQFACKKCETHFWIPYEQSKGIDEFLGIKLKAAHLDFQEEDQREKIEAHEAIQRYEDRKKKSSLKSPILESPELKRSCPKCGQLNPRQEDECRGCGVIISKYRLISSEETEKIPYSVLESWQFVISDYDNWSQHEAFIKDCMKNNVLDFALKKYSHILNANGADDMALSMKKKVVMLSQGLRGFNSSQDELKSKSERLELRAQRNQRVQKTPQRVQKKAKPFKRRYLPRFFGALIGIGLVISVSGFLYPELKNLMGLGASLMFVSFTLLYYTK